MDSAVHMYYTAGRHVGTLWWCFISHAAMTSEHLFQHCPLQDTLQKITWLEDLPLMREGVWGSGNPKEPDGSICRRSCCFNLNMVFEEEEEETTQVLVMPIYFHFSL